MSNKWKILFFILLGINLSFFIALAVIIFSPSEEGTGPRTAKNSKEKMIPFTIDSNKEDLTKVINYYIEQETKGSSIDYSVLLTDVVEFYGTIEVFTQEIELKMTFEPEALENGDLLLTQKSLSLGGLPLPVEYVLKFVNEQYAFPDWVKISPEEQTIYVALMDMDTESGMKIVADIFDLKNDQIQLTFYVPGKDGN